VRDLLFIVIFPLLVYASFKRPFIGAAMWLWVAMHFPNGWVYGFAGSFRYNLLIVIFAFLSYIFWKDKGKVSLDKTSFLIGLFLFWTMITSIFTISIPEFVWAEWIEFLKITLLYFFCIAVLRKKLHIDVMIWALIFSIGFYGCLEGLKYISSGGGHRIHGLAGHVLGDRNELALSFNMLLPLMLYMANVTEKRFIRLGLYMAVVICVVAIIGTYSRGGVVALIIVAGYFWLQSSRKLLYACLFALVVGVGSAYIPSEWSSRMDTIEQATEDNSFLGRILAWKTAVLIANDNLITGAGFKGGQLSTVWHHYEGYRHFNDIVDTSHMSETGFKAAHSIYFQVLGDHGYIGLLIFLSILLVGYLKATRLSRYLKKNGKDPKLINLCDMIRVSIVAYCAGGGAVSLAYFDMLYALFAIIYAIEHHVVKVPTKEEVVRKRRENRFA